MRLIYLVCALVLGLSAQSQVMVYNGNPIMWCAVAIPPAAPTNTLYVATNGNNSLDGYSILTAKRTVSATLPLLTNGMTLFIGPGQYYEPPLTQYNSGASASSRIRVTALYPTNPIAAEVMVTNIVATDDVYGWPPGWLLPHNNFVAFDNFTLTGAGFQGSNQTNNSLDGFLATQTNGSTYVNTLTWTNMVVRGFNRGIFLWSSNNVSGTTNCAIVGSWITNNNYEGILTAAVGNPVGGSHRSLVIVSNEIGNMYSYSDNGHVRAPGGIVPLSCDGFYFAYNCIHDGGTNSQATVAGSFGISSEYSINGTNEYNLIYNWKANLNGIDGGGIDHDHNVANVVTRFNIAYSNDGPAFTIIAGGSGHWFYGNLGWQNSQRSPYGEWTYTSGGSGNVHVFNNTFINWNNNNPKHGIHSESSLGGTNTFGNNIIVTRNNTPPLYWNASTANLDFFNNCWFDATNQANTKFYWNGTTYTGLAAFRTGTGQETGVGFVADPQLFTLNFSGLLPTNVAGIASFVSAYLSTNSPNWKSATNLALRNGSAFVYTKDIKGATVNTNSFSIGAYEESYN